MTKYYFNSLKKRLTLTNLPPAGTRSDRFKLRNITIVCLLSVICMSAHVFSVFHFVEVSAHELFDLLFQF